MRTLAEAMERLRSLGQRPAQVIAPLAEPPAATCLEIGACLIEPAIPVIPTGLPRVRKKERSEASSGGVGSVAGKKVSEKKKRAPPQGPGDSGSGDGVAAKAAAPCAVDLLADRMPAGPDEDALKVEYRERGLDQLSDKFVLYRIIGNDLYPRHRRGQSRENVAFILANEPPLANCTKRWILNRIVDVGERAAIISLLENAGQDYLEIPFDWEEYAGIEFDFELVKECALAVGRTYEALDEEAKLRAAAQMRRLKNNYAMHNNGARNLALRDGRGRAKWILPWDGNCFLTQRAWRDIRVGITEKPWLKYFVIPMARILDNADLLKNDFMPKAEEEPQLVFRCDAVETFDERHPYGRRPKVDLLWRLGVPGIWDRWRYDPWDVRASMPSTEARQHGQAGWVARLYSGQGTLEQSDHKSFRNRGLARAEAIVSTIDHLDRTVLERSFDRSRLVTYSEDRIERMKRDATAGDPAAPWMSTLFKLAGEAMARRPGSVIDKQTLPPSGDPHDYWHPAPYWWPNPETADGLPYIRRDGERVPGTEMYDPDSAKYDRTGLQRVFDDTTVLALAWAVSGESAFAEQAALVIRCWFIDPATRMNPHLRYAQVRLGNNGNEGAHTGVIEMKDLYYFLDAVRLLERAGAFTDKDIRQLQEWLTAYLAWLESSPQGQGERMSANNHGSIYDLQVAAIAAYLGNTTTLQRVFRESRQRLYAHFEPDGYQADEMSRTMTAHYSCFNLQGWLNLAAIAKACGDQLWKFTTADGRSIGRGYEWLQPFTQDCAWPYLQIKPFDRDRYIALTYTYERIFCARSQGGYSGHGAVWSVKPIFYPHDGIRPFWAL